MEYERMKNLISMRKYLLLIVALGHLSFIDAKTILWDLGGVLFKVDRLGMSYYELGWKDFASYMVWDQRSPNNLKDLLFDDLLYRIDAQTPDSFIAYMPDGRRMAPIMMDWLKGMISGHELCNKLHQIIKDLDTRHYFVSERERVLLEKMVKVVFDPQVLARYTKLVNAGIELVELCRKSGCANIVVSNWDPFSYAHLLRTGPGRKIFQLFGQHYIFISGANGIMKPDVALFKKVIEQYHLNPADCLFVDDQIENIRAAESCGIKSYWFQGDYKALKNVLIQEGCLPLS